MKGFLYRDLCAVRRVGKWMAVFVVIVGAKAFGGDPYRMQILLPIYCVMMFVSQAANEEERSGWERFAAAVPDGRRGMVRSKYAVVLLAAAVALCIELLAAVILDATGKQALLFNLQLSLVAVGAALLMAEIYLPMIYTFGYKDGAFLSLLFSAILLFAVGRLAYRGMQARDWDIQGLNVLVIIPLAAMIFLGPSCRASLSACERRDF